MYYGEGKSKKIARVEAATTALQSFIQFKDGATLSPVKGPSTLDFTSDEHSDGIDNHFTLLQSYLMIKVENIL